MRRFATSACVALLALLFTACGSDDAISKVSGSPEMFSYETVWAFSPTDVWVGGSPAMEQRAALAHYDGDAWTTTEVPSYYVASLWGFAPNDLWAVGGEYVLRYDGGTWQETSLREEGGRDLMDIWGSSPEDVWVAGDNGIFHFDGTSWRRQSNSGASAIWGASPSDIWTIGTFDYRHYDGESWTDLEIDLWGGDGAIWGFGPDDVFMAAGDEAIAHWDGATWTTIENDAIFGDLEAIWGPSGDDLWLAGAFGEVARYDGSKLRSIDRQPLGSPYLKRYRDIHGSPDGDVWIVGGILGATGNKGVIYRAGK